MPLQGCTSHVSAVYIVMLLIDLILCLWLFICWFNIGAPRAKRTNGAPWVSKSTHPRKFGIHVTVHRPPARPSAPQGNQCLIFTLSSQFGSRGRLILHTYIAHQCCDQLTAVKTGYPLTSITWPYRGLRCRPIEVKYFFEVIRWQVTSFQVIAGSSSIFF